MVYFSNKSGQLGNRLFCFGHLIANAVVYKRRIVNLSFDEYARYFRTTSKDVLCRYPPVDSTLKSDRLRSWLFVLNKAILKFLRITKIYNSRFHSVVVADLPDYQFTDSRCFDLNEPSHQHRLSTKPVVFLFGRFFRDYQNFEKYKHVVRDFFRPVPSLEENINSYMEKARSGADLMVGVHIRRGDYEQFVGGRYFYSYAQYALAMKALQVNISPRKIKFIICSNEAVDLEEFKGVDALKGPGHLVEDMYVLAACDFIMGPPSTYTLWASFYGAVPLYQIKDPHRLASLNDFVMLPPEVLFNFSFN